MPFPQPAKDFITFPSANQFTTAQITQIISAVAACQSQGLQLPPWNNPIRAAVTSTKVNTAPLGLNVVDVVNVNYFINHNGNEASIQQTVTITGF